jgi:hypothetical protein
MRQANPPHRQSAQEVISEKSVNHANLAFCARAHARKCLSRQRRFSADAQQETRFRISITRGPKRHCAYTSQDPLRGPGMSHSAPAHRENA